MTPLIPDFLVCPVCKGRLFAAPDGKKELLCPVCGLGFEIRDGMPVMMEELARKLPDEEVERCRAAEKKMRSASAAEEIH